MTDETETKGVRGDAGWRWWSGGKGWEAKGKGGKEGEYVPYEKEREVAGGLKLTSERQWREWSKSGRRASDIPGAPHQAYCDAGWTSWPDWMGYAAKGTGGKEGEYLPFEKAREVARGLKLTSERQWREWSKSGKRPSDIPGAPHQAYRDAGWTSWPA